MKNLAKDNSRAFDTIIFGAGPAGLAGATRLITGQKKILIAEKGGQVGGISKTIKYKGYCFDLGGHRFFTKSHEVMNLWEKTLGKDFLTRPRLSRIYYRGKFFNYPLKPINALLNLGLAASFKISGSYLLSKFFPYPEENNFEQWVSNRFGKELYKTFFKAYTEKLWGLPCTEIQAEWAAQRIKGLSLKTVLKNAFLPDKKGSIKTLIDKFRYPKYGPGMMYEKMAGDIQKAGGEILLESAVSQIRHSDFRIKSVILKNKNGQEKELFADDFISSMPVTELVKRMSPQAPAKLFEAAEKLKYRSFVTVEIILNSPTPFPDNWIYVHSPEVKMCRIQSFGNWSPHMLARPNTAALGLEYFCNEKDDFWKTPDQKLIKLGLRELETIGLGRRKDFIDGFVVRVPKAYPVYDSSYPRNIEMIRNYLQKFKNLQPVGRYGMFKYNNMDHSILTGLYAAENILGANYDIWKVNADQEYHEEN